MNALSSNLRKAAVLIRSLDADSAASLLAQLSAEEARELAPLFNRWVRLILKSAPMCLPSFAAQCPSPPNLLPMVSKLPSHHKRKQI